MADAVCNDLSASEPIDGLRAAAAEDSKVFQTGGGDAAPALSELAILESGSTEAFDFLLGPLAVDAEDKSYEDDLDEVEILPRPALLSSFGEPIFFTMRWNHTKCGNSSPVRVHQWEMSWYSLIQARFCQIRTRGRR